MAEVPSVNPEQHQPVPDSEAEGLPWADPAFAQQNPERLPDEPEPAEQPQRQPAADGKGDLTAEQIQALLDSGKTADDGEDDDAGDDVGEAGQARDKRPRRRSDARRARREAQRRAEEAAREAAYYCGQVEALQRGQQPQKPAEQAEEDPQPKLGDYDDHGKWADDMAAWTKRTINVAIEQRDAQDRQRREAEQARTRQQQAQRAQEQFEARLDGARQRYGDFDDAVFDEDAFIPEIALPAIYGAENGPDIAYYLANHPDEARRIGGLNQADAFRALGRIEARIEAEQASRTGTAAEQAPATPAKESTPKAAERPPARPSTRAPEPVPVLSGGGTASRDPAKMSMEEYRAWRLKSGN